MGKEGTRKNTMARTALRRAFMGLGVVVGLTAGGTAQAGVVGVFGERFNLNIINDFYNGLAGHSSSILGSIEGGALAPIDLLWAVQPDDAYSAGEISAMSTFLANGGRIAFMGEHGTFAPDENNRISAAISALGGHVTINNTVVDGGFRDATVADGQILDHSLTENVLLYRYAAFAPLIFTGVGPEILMVGEENFPNNIMMAFENIGPGSIFLITDQNVWDPVNDTAGNDNAVLFENLLQASTGAPPVCGAVGQPPCPAPEPGGLAGLALFGFALAGLSRAMRRRAA